MSAKWQTATLGDIACNISRPFDFKNINSVVFVNTGDVLNGEFLHENKVDAKGLPGQAKKAIEKGDILYSEIRPGNKRYVLISKDNVENFVVSTKFMVIKATGPVSPEYLYLILTSRECEEEFKVIADSRSGTFPQITFDSVSYYPVRFPSAKLQKTVVAIDGAITKKIQLNHQINQTLEQIAQALFKSWFVDFDPVKAKIDVLEAGGSEEEALLAAMQVISSKNAEELAAFEVEKPEEYAKLRVTAELFPAAMVESELGEIPEGWETKLSGDVVDIRDGTHDSPKRANEGFPLVTSRHITSGVLNLEETYLISESDFDSVNRRSKVDQGDILLSMIGTVGVPFFVIQSDVNFAIKNLGLFKTSKIKELGSFFYLLLKTKSMRFYLESRTAGTTQKYLSLRALRSLEFVLPRKEVLYRFSEKVAPIFSKIEQNRQHSFLLSQLRNTLLPKLLSGELDVSELADSLEAEA